MTKQIVKWYKKMDFWNFIGFVVAPIAAIGEGAILTFEGPAWLHGAVFVAVVVTGWMKFNIKDENKNGIADRYEE